jgi:hypothetical protein
MVYRRLAILAACALALLTGGPQAPLLPDATVSGDAPRKLALLIGINEYRSPTLLDLRGCVNDVLLMRTVLTNQFGFEPEQVTVLADAQATRQGIIDAFRALTAKARAGDVVVVHYSGHGSRMKDASGDESDGLDETIVPHDSREGDVFDISDDELNGLLRELSRKTSNVTVVLDSCHSGSATRGGAATRRAPDDPRDPPPASAFAQGSRGVSSDASDVRTRDARYVLITGCKSHQLSNEQEIDGSRQGVMTYHLARALREAGAQATYRDVMDRVAGEVSALFPSQEPELEGAAVDALLFREEEARVSPYVLVSPQDGGKASMEAGTLYGLTSGVVLEVHEPGARSFEPTAAIARVKVTSVDAFRATGDIVAGQVKPFSRAILRERVYPDFKLKACFQGLNASAALRSIKQGLAAFPMVATVEDVRDCQLLLKQDAGHIVTLGGDMVERSPRVPVDANTTKRVTEQVLQWAKWQGLHQLENPSPPFPVRLRLTPIAPAVRPGERIAVAAENLSDLPLFVTALDLSSDGSVSVLYPAPGQGNQVIPAHSTGALNPIEFFVPEGRDSVQDTIKLFATTTPLDARLFQQPAVRSTDPAPAGPRDPLAALIEQTSSGRARGARPVPLGAWATSQHMVTVSRNAPAITAGTPTPAPSPSSVPPATASTPGALGGFVLHFREGDTRAAGAAPRGVRDLCGPGVTRDSQPCWQFESLSPDGSSVELIPAGSQAARDAPPPAAAWDEAYRLRRETGAERVEPAVEYDQSAWGVEDEAPARGGKNRPNKCAARADTEWSLKHIHAHQAWALLQHDKGRADGEEGRNVIIAHPDTGYREHPEFWDADEGRSSTLYGAGYDFLDKDPNPFDEMDTGGLIPNPGHGTKSGSTIVSPKGKQWPGDCAALGRQAECAPQEVPADKCYVSGVAPGSHLIPMRVHRSVVHFFPGRLAKAIYTAAGTDRTLVKKPSQVVSVSMGGAPSFGLWKAVKFAEKQGVIVVAAAGNEVGFVVWPARFGQTVAVAATNVECGIWEGSSKGGAVDISAPGESVWRAETDLSGHDSAGMGQGTTFATATTAGVAALWLDYNTDASGNPTPQIAQLRASGQLTKAFRKLLQDTSWKPSSPPSGVTCVNTAWDPKKHGPGIVNVEALLKASIPSPASLPRAADEQEALPLFASLFPAETTPAVVEERFRRLLRLSAGRPTEAVADLEGEIVHHYSTDAATQAALDALTVSAPGEPAFAEARRVLLTRPLSERLRAVLEGRGE